MVLQGSSPDGPWRHNIHYATVNLKNHKNSQKFSKIIKNHQNAPKPKIHFMSGNVTSMLVDENSAHHNNSCQILRNHPRCHSGASGGVWGGVNALRFRQSAPT